MDVEKRIRIMPIVQWTIRMTWEGYNYTTWFSLHGLPQLKALEARLSIDSFRKHRDMKHATRRKMEIIQRGGT